MTDSSDLNEEFNNAIDDFLPEGIEPNDIDPESESKPVADDANQEEHRWGRILRDWHTLQSVDKYRRDELAEREIEYYTEELDLPARVGKMSEQLFNQYVATQDHLVVELTAAAAVYSAAKVNEVGITPDALVDAGDNPLDRTILLRQSKDIVNELGLDPEAFFNSDVYVDEFCEELDLSKGINTRAKQILTYCDEAGISGGKSPTGWAGAAIYLACIEHDCSTSQNAIADVADVTTVTIRNRYSEQREVVVERECPDEIGDIVDWACNRIDLPDEIRAEARAITETDLDLTIRGQHEIPLSFDEDSLGWAMAAVKVAADNHDHSLNYRPLKTLSGYPAENLKRRSRAIKNYYKTSQKTPNESEEEESDARDSYAEGDNRDAGSGGTTIDGESFDDDTETVSSTPGIASDEPKITGKNDDEYDTAEIPDEIVSTIERLDDETLQSLQSVIVEVLAERQSSGQGDTWDEG